MRPPQLDRHPLTLWLALALLATAAAWLPPIPQPPGYHDFADRSSCFGIPHCADTTSNLLFIVAGVAGLVFLHGARHLFLDRREAPPYRLFFAAVVLVGLASGYYHLAPSNERLAWDRAAIALAFMAWFGAVLGERVQSHGARRLLPLLVLAGLGSVAYWHWSEGIGRGDLRPYLLMQAMPLLLIPLLLRLYPPRYGGGGCILGVLGLYLLALACDLLDRPLAQMSGMVSGHTLKHVLAAAAAGLVLRTLQRRRPL